MVFVRLLIALTCSQGLLAQLPLSDTHYIEVLGDKLSLTGDQKEKVLRLYLDSQQVIDSLDNQIALARGADLTALLPGQSISDLHQKKKDVREIRDLGIVSILTEDQRNKYEQDVRPARPQVLHFGMTHDRMNCNVCNK
jgi:hypothetical protein